MVRPVVIACQCCWVLLGSHRPPSTHPPTHTYTRGRACTPKKFHFREFQPLAALEGGGGRWGRVKGGGSILATDPSYSVPGTNPDDHPMRKGDGDCSSAAGTRADNVPYPSGFWPRIPVNKANAAAERALSPFPPPPRDPQRQEASKLQRGGTCTRRRRHSPNGGADSLSVVGRRRAPPLGLGWVGLGQGLIRSPQPPVCALTRASPLGRGNRGCPVSRPSGLLTAPVPRGGTREREMPPGLLLRGGGRVGGSSAPV